MSWRIEWGEARVWLVTLLQVARCALADQPQLLEALEIPTP